MTRDRYFFLLNFFICAGLSGVAFYYNYVERVPVCPLCSLQLICYYLIGMISLMGFFHEPTRVGHRIYTVMLSLLCVLGVIFAARQLWMQHLPASQILPCSPNIAYMLQNFSFSQTIDTIFNQADECSMVHWQFLTISMAGWSLFFYIIVAISSLCTLIFAPHERKKIYKKKFT